MKTYQQFIESNKTCPKGEYYCHTDKKCKKIPSGWHVGRRGYIEKDEDEDIIIDNKNILVLGEKDKILGIGNLDEGFQLKPKVVFNAIG